MFINLLAIFFLFFVLGLLATAVISLFIRVPYVPSKKNVIKKLLKEITFKKGQKIYDLGCGDGRILFCLERMTGIAGTGYEIAPLVYILAHIQKLLKGSKATIHFQNFFKANLSDADIILCYLTPKILEKLTGKLQKECKKGTKIISHTFEMKGLTPIKTIARTEKMPPLYIYQL